MVIDKSFLIARNCKKSGLLPNKNQKSDRVKIYNVNIVNFFDFSFS